MGYIHSAQVKYHRIWHLIQMVMLLSIANSLMAAEVLPKGSLSGRIIDPDGKPINNAKVWINTWDDKLLAATRSDEEGRFRLSDIEPFYQSSFYIFIDAEGFARQYIPNRDYSVFPGTDFDLGAIQVDRGRIFSGQVLDEDGKPRPDAEIFCETSILSAGHGSRPIGDKYRLQLDPEARYRTPPMNIGHFYITATAPGMRLVWINRIVQPGGEEELAPLYMKNDTPIVGTVKNEKGEPIAGANISASDVCKTTSDSAGHFVIHGFGPNPNFQFQLIKDGYLFINWGVQVRDDGIYWRNAGQDKPPEHSPTKELSVVLKPVAWIQGEAKDIDTGRPVQLDTVVLCYFERKENGEVVLSGCRSWGFEQPEQGHFRISYESPDEFHLTFSAAGYNDAEAFTPKVTELKNIGGIEVKMKKKSEGAKPSIAKQSIYGTITRNGNPVKTGWVGLLSMPGERHQNAINVKLLRGRTTVGDPFCINETPIRDGKYSLDVPHQDDNWFISVREPGQAITQIGPLKIDLNQKEILDIACTAGGGISGRIKNVPNSWEGRLWVIAFNKTAIQKETRVDSDGKYCFRQLPPGDYGLKVGHDAFQDSEVYRGDDEKAFKEAFERKVDPWKRAITVKVESGQEIKGIELELPEN